MKFWLAGVAFVQTAGKDRTGVIIALLLALLGVSYEDRVADYMLSDTEAAQTAIAAKINYLIAKSRGLDEFPQADVRAALLPLLGVDRSAIEGMEAVLAVEWGSALEYCTLSEQQGGLGIPMSEIEAFRAAMLE